MIGEMVQQSLISQLPDQSVTLSSDGDTQRRSLPPPLHRSSRAPFRAEWMVDTKVASPGWTMEYVETKENRRPLDNNVLATYAAGRGTAGELGILARIFQIIGETNRWCCEFGASDGIAECNTYNFVRKHDWSAVYIEPDELKYQRLKSEHRDRSSVFSFQNFVDFDPPNLIDRILAKTPCPKNLDLMVIDVDGCDYHIWQSISDYLARVVMVEFNSTIPGDVYYVPPRDMNIHHGCSLRALDDLARARGYELVATNGWNAFFVRKDLFWLFGIQNNHPTAMHRAANIMKLFQLYDGTLVLGTWAQLHWLPLQLALEDIQVLPKNLRHFSRRLATVGITLLPDGNLAPAASICPPLFTKANRFAAYARNVTSSYGDDGIIAALLDVVARKNQTFLDFGCFGVKHGSRVWQLASVGGWRGYIVRVPSSNGAWTCAEDFSCDGVTYIDLSSVLFLGGLEFVRDIRRAITNEIDILSIGVDGSDYQAWQSLHELRPIIVAVQFNPTIPNDIFFVQAPDFSVHQGCSLNALIELGKQQGYELAACSLATAFFVRNDRFSELGIQRNDIDLMYAPTPMQLFQLFDGTLRLAGRRRLLWHGIELADDEIQVLPRALRRWPTTLPPGPHSDLFVQVN